MHLNSRLLSWRLYTTPHDKLFIMENSLVILRHNRAIFSRFLKHFSLAQLNTIPDGYNNSIFWNIAHCLVTLQRLVYGLSGLPLGIDAKWIASYNKGTKPTRDVTKEEVEELLRLFESTFIQLTKDVEDGVFKDFQPYTTSTKMELKSVEDALRFSLFHEGIHVGSVLALAKLV